MKYSTKHQEKKHCIPCGLALLILACLLLLAGCENRYRTFSLVLEDIDYSGSPNLFIALNNQPEIFGNFLSYGVTIEPGQGTARIDDIQVERSADTGEDTAWLLVAEDTDGNGSLNEGDQLIPAMRIQLPRELDEIVISGLRFNSGSNTVPLLFADEHTFGLSIFISNPEQVSSLNPIYISCYDGPDTTVASSSANFVYNSADFVRQLVVRINQPASPHVLAWWDANANAILDLGDWMSSDRTQAQNIDSGNSTLILSPLLVEP
ncbi:MAG: hypothetical protein KKI09_04490 [Spirochaetes bacterium]|nr:hypothetical protein [Spirochaetota bacterium]MBU0954669.1 hypothetical protein [Spirochaetota bacterium]